MAAIRCMDSGPMACALRASIVCCCASWGGSAPASGDIVVYKSREMSTAFVLPEGTAKMLPGHSIVFQIPKVGYLRLHADTSRIIKAPTREQRFRRRLRVAEHQQDVELALSAARFALHHALLESFYEAARLAWKLEPHHPTVERLAAAEKHIRRPVDDADVSIERLGKLLSLEAPQIETSDHYALIYDADATGANDLQSSLVNKRLELLEGVYRTFFLKFALEGKALPTPAQRLPVVLFTGQEAYQQYANSAAPNLRQSAGFWSPENNLAAFVNQDTHDFHRAFRRDAEWLGNRSSELIRWRAKGSRDAIQFAGTMDKLAGILQDQSDVAIVTHEAIHQLAGNTGLIPRGRFTLIWAHEGLASYFETPAGAGWGGVGAVNRHRLKWYRALQHDPLRASLEFVVSDRIFDAAQDEAARMAAYGQAWALTHFLMETRFTELMRYYQSISQLETSPQGVARDRLVRVFDEAFGDRRSLEQEWRSYMSGLESEGQGQFDVHPALHVVD